MLDPVGVFDSKSLNFSHVGVVESPANLIYISGQTGVDANAQAPDSYADQVRLACKNLGLCLRAAGATPRNIVKLTYFIVGYDSTNRVHAPIMTEFLEGHRPTSTLVSVSALAKPGWLFEVEAVASVPALSLGSDVEEEGGKNKEVDVVVVGGGLSGLQVGG